MSINKMVSSVLGEFLNYKSVLILCISEILYPLSYLVMSYFSKFMKRFAVCKVFKAGFISHMQNVSSFLFSYRQSKHISNCNHVNSA